MKVADDHQFTLELGGRFNITVPHSFRKHLRGKGIELKPHDTIVLAFVRKTNGEGTKQKTLLEIDGVGEDGGRARAEKGSQKG